MEIQQDDRLILVIEAIVHQVQVQDQVVAVHQEDHQWVVHHQEVLVHRQEAVAEAVAADPQEEVDSICVTADYLKLIFAKFIINW